MKCTLFRLYFTLVTCWSKHVATLFFLCIFVLFLLTLMGLSEAHSLLRATGFPPNTDPGGGGPW